MKEVNLLTDILFLEKHDNCQAGEYTFALSPLSKMYTCCADFSNNEDSFIGDAREGIIKECGSYLYEIENNNLCRICDSYQCSITFILIKKNTK